jgi:hypothetical protein
MSEGDKSPKSERPQSERPQSEQPKHEESTNFTQIEFEFPEYASFSGGQSDAEMLKPVKQQMQEIDLNALFTLTYSFDALKVAIETLANNIDGKDQRMADFMGEMKASIIRQGKGIRKADVDDIEALRKEMEARLTKIEGNMNVAPAVVNTSGSDIDIDAILRQVKPFDPTDLQNQIDDLKNKMSSMENKMLMMQPSSGDGMDMNALE